MPSSTVRYARQFVSLEPSVSLALRDAAKQRDVPLNGFFQAAWSAYLFSKLGYPLRVDVFPTEPISLQISYDQTQFDDQSVAGLLAAFRARAERIAADGTGTVSILLYIAQASAARANAGGIVFEGAARISDVRAASAV